MQGNLSPKPPLLLKSAQQTRLPAWVIILHLARRNLAPKAASPPKHPRTSMLAKLCALQECQRLELAQLCLVAG